MIKMTLEYFFLDLDKAFDSVDHVFLWRVLEAYGFGVNFRAFIALLYTDIFSIMKVNNELISTIQVQRGVQQGCPVSGLLFALAITITLYTQGEYLRSNVLSKESSVEDFCLC